MHRLTFFVLLIATLPCTASAEPRETARPDEKLPENQELDDTPADLMRRYFDAFEKQDKEGYKNLWATEEHIEKFYKLLPAEFAPKSDAKRAEYIRKSLEQQAKRIDDELRDMDESWPKFEILKAEAEGLALDGQFFESISITTRDLATKKEKTGSTAQEGIKIDGRWYFYERP